MKKLLYLFVAAGLLMTTACKKDKDGEGDDENGLNPTQTQNGFAINYTATWCGHCGNWGAPLIHDYAKDAPNGVAICAHASGDPMNNSLYNSFRGDRTTGGGIPSFWVGDQKTTNKGAMKAMLNQAVPCGVDDKYSVSDGKMTVDTKVKFFQGAQGDYYLSVLVLEDGINGNSSAGQYKQSGTSQSYPNDDYKHDFVLRASAQSGNAYGEMIVQNPEADKEIEKSYTINVDASWKNPYAVCIIWKKDASGGAPNYKFVNSLKKKN
jgi:hypothetical protein